MFDAPSLDNGYMKILHSLVGLGQEGQFLERTY